MVITAGKLKHGQEYEVRYMTVEDMEVILELQEKVLRTLEDPDRLQPLRKDEYESILKNGRLMIGIFTKDKLIAFRAFLKPIDDEEGLGSDAGLSEEEKRKIIYSEISAVDPEFRGEGLQKYMGKILMDGLDAEAIRYVLATVAPFNIPSLKDKFALGLQIVGLKEKYNGKMRYIFMKDLERNAKKAMDEAEIAVHMGDIPRQQELLLDGFIGTSMVLRDGEWHIWYER